MNQQDINKVKQLIDKYFELDLANLIMQTYPNASDSDIVIGDYSTKEFLSTSNKVFNQFKVELEGTYFKSLPLQCNFNNEYGNGNLITDLANFNSYITSNRFPNAVNVLRRLVHYQAVNGFWEKSNRKYFRTSRNSIEDEKERIVLVSRQLETQTNNLKKLTKELEDNKTNLRQFTESKKKELSELEALLTVSRAHNTEINTLHASATSVSEKITSLLNASDTQKSNTDTLYKESRAEFKELEKRLEEQSQTIKKQNSEYENLKTSFQEKLSYVEEKYHIFEERNQYLNDLIGREVGASLFETFKQRKEELNSSISFWQWSIPVTAVATIVWIFFLFGNGNLADLAWQIVLVNSLKALPAVGILLFSISQYTKERNFQEEYAFKSAVALTVNSYANQLQVNENKDKLIMESVNEIYKTPISQKNKDIEAKSLIGTAKELTDVAKSIVGKNT